MRLMVAIAATIYACIITFAGAVFLKVSTFVRTQALAEDRRLMELANYNAERIIDSVQKTALGLYYGLDVQTVINASERHDLVALESKAIMINDIATANTNVLSVELYNHKLGRLFSGPNAPTSDTVTLPKYIQTNKALPRLRLVSRDLTPSYGEPSSQTSILSLFMFDVEASPGGALVLNIDPKWLFESIDLLNRGERPADLYIVSSDGKVLHGTVSSSDIGIESMLKSISPRPQLGIQQRVIGLHNKATMITIARPRGAAFTLVEVRPIARALLPYERLLYSLLAISLLFLVLISATVAIVSRRLYRPVGRLLRSVHGEPIPLDSTVGGDEFSYLTRVFSANLAELRHLQTSEESNRSIVKWYFLRNLLYDGLSSEDDTYFSAIKTDLNIDLDARLLIVLAMRLDQPTASSERSLACESTTTELTKRFGSPLETVDVSPNETVFLLAAEADAEHQRNSVIEELKEAAIAWGDRFDSSLAFAISDWIDDRSKLSEEFRRLRSNIHYFYVWGPGAVIENYSVVEHERRCVRLDHLPEELELRNSVIHGNLQAFRASLESVVQQIANQPLEDVMSSASDLVAIYMLSLRARHDMGRVAAYGFRSHDLRARLGRCTTIWELERTLVTHLEGEINGESSLGQNKVAILADAAKRYVEQNWDNKELYLPKIAEVFRVNPTYLGRVFKNVNGIGLVDYIHSIRIENARTLLLHTELSIPEIMDRVGFHNRSNFYRVFRQFCGVTPRQFVATNYLSAGSPKSPT